MHNNRVKKINCKNPRIRTYHIYMSRSIIPFDEGYGLQNAIYVNFGIQILENYAV